MITKRQLLEHYKTQVAIADLLKISKQAVSRWGLDDPIPETQELRLRYEIAPNLFGIHSESHLEKRGAAA